MGVGREENLAASPHGASTGKYKCERVVAGKNSVFMELQVSQALDTWATKRKGKEEMVHVT